MKGPQPVRKEKVINGKTVVCFISFLIPTSAATAPRAQDTLPYIGTFTGLLLEEGDSLYLDSEGLQSAFSLFNVRDQWPGFFSYFKKVDGAAFGLPARKMVRPALPVIPIRWHSAVGVVPDTRGCTMTVSPRA